VSTVLDVVAGAAIGGFVAIAQTLVSGRNARQVTEATIEGEHRQRLWEKQSAAYEATVNELLARQTRREALTSRGDPGNIGSHPVQELRKAEELENIQIRAALRAYASEDVWAASEEADKANVAFWVSLSALASAVAVLNLRAQQVHEGESEEQLTPTPDYQGALDAMNQAKSDARRADDALFGAINRELAWKPPSVGKPTASRSRAGRFMRRQVPY
jgi:hypothetical protein